MNGPAGFQSMRVVTFESRRSGQMASLLERQGAGVLAAPSMRELPIAESPRALAFAEALLAGKIDIVVFLTGVGAKALMSIVEPHHPRAAVLEALRGVTVAVRGPKPVAVLREWGLAPDLTAPEPNTWRELVKALDGWGSLAGKRIAVQEYGESNQRLIAALSERGASVDTVAVYNWALPEDVGPMHEAINAIIAGEVGAVAFTSAQQVRNVLRVAADAGREAPLRDALRRVVIASIGPTCTETLVDLGLGADFEPDRTRMTDLARGLGREAADLLARKRASHETGVDTSAMKRVEVVWPPPKSCPGDDPLHDSAFLRACRREKTDYTPIWLMRQAGRYQRAYRELRERVSFLELCRTPELAAEVTLFAVDQLGVDAAIIFADILLIVEPMGVGLTFNKGEGPHIERPVREAKDVEGLSEVDPEALSYVYDAVRLTRRALRPDIPLIGFCGAPFTVASYMIEGGSSRHFEQTKALMYRDPGLWNALLERITPPLAAYLNRQIAAGAQAVQVFDSWVGCLSESDYRKFVLPHSKALIDAVLPGIPVLHFGTDTTVLLKAMREAGGDVIGLDWRVELGPTWERLGHDVAVQGNLDPTVLLATPAEIERRAKAILDQAGGRPGHIFNLGHGLLPSIPVDHVQVLVDVVHEHSRR